MNRILAELARVNMDLRKSVNDMQECDNELHTARGETMSPLEHAEMGVLSKRLKETAGKVRFGAFAIPGDDSGEDLTKSVRGAERPGHKYKRREPDGKGSWVYFYDDEPAEEPGAEVIGKGNTGDVVKKGNFVYKNVAVKGKPTQEGAAYKKLKGVPGIAQGEQVGDKIKVPYYRHIVSTDEVPKEKRSQVAHIVSKNILRINRAVSELSNKGIRYSDPLQFGLDAGKMDLLDFSNASFVEPGEAREDNYMHLRLFYRAFGLDKISGIVSDAMELYDNLSYADDVPSFDDALVARVKKMREQLGGSPRGVYYATNARHVQLKGIVQTPHNDGYLLVASLNPLSDAEIDEYELRPVYVADQAMEKSMKGAVMPGHRYISRVPNGSGGYTYKYPSPGWDVLDQTPETLFDTGSAERRIAELKAKFTGDIKLETCQIEKVKAGQKYLNKDKVNSMADEIRRGKKMPVCEVMKQNQELVIKDGHHRLGALKHLGYTGEVPLIVLSNLKLKGRG